MSKVYGTTTSSCNFPNNGNESETLRILINKSGIFHEPYSCSLYENLKMILNNNGEQNNIQIHIYIYGINQIDPEKFVTLYFQDFRI